MERQPPEVVTLAAPTSTAGCPLPEAANLPRCRDALPGAPGAEWIRPRPPWIDSRDAARDSRRCRMPDAAPYPMPQAMSGCLMPPAVARLPPPADGTARPSRDARSRWRMAGGMV